MVKEWFKEQSCFIGSGYPENEPPTDGLDFLYLTFKFLEELGFLGTASSSVGSQVPPNIGPPIFMDNLFEGRRYVSFLVFRGWALTGRLAFFFITGSYVFAT
jgi:hypothetical protein